MTRRRNEPPKTDDPTWGNWLFPVVLQTGTSHRTTQIANPAEALAFLTIAWGGEKDGLHHSARLACSQALRRRVPSEAAKEAFVRFAEKARLLGEPPGPESDGTDPEQSHGSSSDTDRTQILARPR